LVKEPLFIDIIGKTNKPCLSLISLLLLTWYDRSADPQMTGTGLKPLLVIVAKLSDLTKLKTDWSIVSIVETSK
jgi:hypothetical protein